MKQKFTHFYLVVFDFIVIKKKIPVLKFYIYIKQKKNSLYGYI